MSKRSYDQYCGVAKALDVLGERWTLLVVRELLLGPRRYRDLAAQLPGVATDMLTARLRMLTEHGLVERMETGGVGGGITYALTPAGFGLRPLVEQLATFGLGFMTAPAETSDEITLRWALATVRVWLDPARCPIGTCQLVTEEERYELRNDGTTVTLTYAPTPSDPASVVLTGNEFDLVALLTGHVRPSESLVAHSGNSKHTARWLAAIVAAFPAPIGATSRQL